VKNKVAIPPPPVKVYRHPEIHGQPGGPWNPG